MSSILAGRRTLVVASLGADSEADRVFIESLEVDTVIDVYDWECGIRQCLRLNLTLGQGSRPAAAGNDLALALDRATLSEQVQKFAQESHFQSVETFAERLAEVLMGERDIPWLRVRVTKPGTVPAVRSVGAEIKRGCR